MLSCVGLRFWGLNFASTEFRGYSGWPYVYEQVALDQKGSSWRAAGEVWGWWWACRASVLSKHCKAAHTSNSSAFGEQNGQGTLCHKCRVCAEDGSKLCILLLQLQSQHCGGKVAHRACALQSIWFQSFAFNFDSLILVREQASCHVR